MFCLYFREKGSYMGPRKWLTGGTMGDWGVAPPPPPPPAQVYSPGKTASDALWKQQFCS